MPANESRFKQDEKSGLFMSQIMTYRKRFNLIVCLASIVFGIGLYWHTLDYPFELDDVLNIVNNHYIRLQRLDFESLHNAAFKSILKTRPIANLSFALNYYFSEYRPAPYRLTNIFIHIINGLLIYALSVMTLRLLHGQASTGAEKTGNWDVISADAIQPVGAVAAIVWLVHPLHTQSVIYVVQRMNSLAACFYLGALCLYIRGRLVPERKLRIIYFISAVFSWILALGCKEIAATLPIVIIVYEWFFFQQLNLSWLRERAIVWGVLLLIFGLIALYFLGDSPIQNILSGYRVRDFTLLERQLTQFRVIALYLSLIFLPLPGRMNLEHHFTKSISLFEPITTLITFFLIIGLVALAVVMSKRSRLLAFCILWFFIHLAIESSIIPLEMAFEHRTYLPCFGIIMFAVLVIWHKLPSVFNLRYALAAAVVLLLSTATVARSFVWQSELTLWTDCVNKSPNKARSHGNLCYALIRADELNEAKAECFAAVQLDPKYYNGYNLLAIISEKHGDYKKAKSYYKRALSIYPDFADANYNYGNFLVKEDQLDEGIKYLRRARKQYPKNWNVLLALGKGLAKKGNIDEAIKYFKEVIALAPEKSAGYTKMGIALVKKGRLAEAISYFKNAAELSPESTLAWYHLGNGYLSWRKFDQALEQYKHVLDLEPNHAKAHYQIGNIAFLQKKYDKARSWLNQTQKLEPGFINVYGLLGQIDFLENKLEAAAENWLKVIKHQPKNVRALKSIGDIMLKKGDYDAALPYYTEVLALNSGNAIVHNNIAAIYAQKNNIEKAIEHYQRAISLKPDYADARKNLKAVQNLLRQKDKHSKIVISQ